MGLGSLRRSIASPAVHQAVTTGGTVDRPPSVRQSLWEAVPESARDEAIKRAARDLRRGVHPETSIKSFLAELGLPTVAAARPRISLGGRLSRGRLPASQVGKAPEATAPVSADRPMRASAPQVVSPAEAKKAIMLAIAHDPVSAYSDPTSLRAMGVRLPIDALEAASDMIRDEAEKMIASYRERKAAGDPRMAKWIDPDGWSFNLDEITQDCGPAPSA